MRSRGVRRAVFAVLALIFCLVAASASASGSGPRNSALIGQYGALFGAYVDLNGDMHGGLDAEREILKFERNIGRPLDLDLHFVHWGRNLMGMLERWDLKNGRIPVITWEPWGTTLRKLAQGREDRYIREQARSVVAAGQIVFIRFAHEMNGNWYPWTGVENNSASVKDGPQRYIAAWRHVHSIFQQEGAVNALWVWAPNSEDVPRAKWNHWNRYYPGDDVVDWIGFDGYNWGTAQDWSHWRSFRTIFAPLYHDYAGRKPLMVAETATVSAGGNKALWIANAHKAMKSAFPKMSGFIYYNAPGWLVSTSKSSFRAYKRMAADPYFNVA